MLLKKTYTISVTIQEGRDEFWDSFAGRSGCDEVVDAVKQALTDHGFVAPECAVRLDKFEKREPL